jgi:hypothetical protein
MHSSQILAWVGLSQDVCSRIEEVFYPFVALGFCPCLLVGPVNRIVAILPFGDWMIE